MERRTLKKWVKQGFLKSVRPGNVGPWLFDISATSPIESASGPVRETAVSVAVAGDAGAGGNAKLAGADVNLQCDERVDVIYARVSTRKQLAHLTTQIAGLQRKHPGCRVFKDCASGLNFKRKGLQALLQLAAQGRVRNVHVAYRDRLCRFAYELVEFVLGQHGATIVVDADDAQSPEQDLADDVLSVITVFGARLYGKRSGGRRRQQATQEDGDPADTDADAAGGGGSEAEDAAPVPAQGGGGGSPALLQSADATDARADA
ncbi:MAG: IS607 family transposase [Actinomycetales bacterium]